MGLIDFLLNLAALLLWLSWRAVRFDPLVRTSASSLVGTLRRAEPKKIRGWQLGVGLVALLLFRAWFYTEIGPEADWTPRLNLVAVTLAFRSDHFATVLLYSALAFLRVLLVFYFWLLALAVLNDRATDANPCHRLVRLHLGRPAQWPWPVQAFLPMLVTTVLWLAVRPLLLRCGVVLPARSTAHVLEQGLLLSFSLYFSLKYLLPAVLLLHLVASYVYLGGNPFWEFIATTARNLLAPLRGWPLRVGRLDFSPLIGAVLLLLLLQVLPGLLLRRLPQWHVTLWPQ